KSPMWYEGILVKLLIDNQGKTDIDFIPYTQFKDKECVQAMAGNERQQFLNAFKKRSDLLLSDNFVVENWKNYCQENKYTYFSRLHGYNRLFRVLNRVFHFSDWIYPSSKKIMIRNVVECETHREVLETLWRMEK
ncbi:MAG: hypothetical protein HQK65_13130, partial [Desulfamplus sp.]|nr:hypothetical protein [Desulfamplus sp.]